VYFTSAESFITMNQCWFAAKSNVLPRRPRRQCNQVV